MNNCKREKFDYKSDVFDIEIYETYVIGLNHINEFGKSRIEVLEDYLSKKVSLHQRYDGYKDQDILSEDFYYSERIFEYNYSEIGCIELIEEKENVFDTDPIKAYHNKMGDLGYIPRIQKETVRKILHDKKILYTRMNIRGGRYKEVRVDRLGNHSIETGVSDYEILLVIAYSNS